VNDDEIRGIAAGVARRGGILRLLHLLGFDGRPHRRPLSDALRSNARRLSRVARETICAHILELRDGSAADALRELVTIIRRDDPLAHHVFVVVEHRRRRVIVGCEPIGARVRHVVIEPAHVRASDVDVLRELAILPGESGTATALRLHRALDRRRLTGRFFRDVRGIRDAIARAWTGMPDDAVADRDALALLLLSRLMFLYFLQRRGLLADDTHYLPRLLARWRRRDRAYSSFYRGVLRVLFFGALNRRPERRAARALALGELPYLNGGLFDLHRLERGRSALDIPDEVIAATFVGLLERYRFTSSNETVGSVDSIGAGIDPEMLGRIFEGLMPGERRTRTGTFYTPAPIVDALVADVLATHISSSTGVSSESLRELMAGEASAVSDRDLVAISRVAHDVRVIDPACGSGAFLLGALTHLATLRTAADGNADAMDIRADIVARSLHGVDLLDDASLICSLRLWLSLIPQCDRIADVPPLPNLDRRIRQGDALIDPLDVGAAFTGRVMPPDLRDTLRRLEPCAHAYLRSAPEERAGLRRELQRLESRLARAWLDALERGMRNELRELSARAGDQDLFGEPATAAIAARARLPVATSRLSALHAFRADLRGSRAVPFFSFRVHFAEVDAFDIVLCNPPWVRTHHWPTTTRRLLREQFRVCRDAGWPFATTLSHTPHAASAQVDLAFLFLERSIRLVRDGGTLGMVLPAKLLRSLAPGGARALLLESTCIVTIEDHALDQRAIFEADSFTAVLIAQRCAAPPPPDHAVHVRMTRGDNAELRFDIRTADLPLRADDIRSPWLVAPPDCAAALRAMQRAGTCIANAGLRVRRGAMTSANDVMVVRDVEPKLGDLARIRADGWYARGRQDRRAFGAYLESSVLRPVLRGADVHAFRASPTRHVIWSPRNDDVRAAQPRHLGRYLARHGRSRGTLQRISPGIEGCKVVWPDLASDLRAAAVPARMRTSTGIDAPIVPLNTVYFIPVTSEADAHLIAAYMNSLPLRTFARAIAERAKDAHFRFFAWAIAMLPLPRNWRGSSIAPRLTEISRCAHRDGCIAPALARELDALVAQSFGLGADHIDGLAAFDAWLRGGE